MATNPLTPQGVLNRVRTSIVVPSFPGLNITASFMGKSFAKPEFEGNFVEQIETGTGVVNSPEPFVMCTITVGILRTQPLAAAYMAQFLNNSALGTVTAHADTSAFPPITLVNTVIRHLDPGAWDGTDPVSRLTLRGAFYINANLWNFA